MLRKEAIETGKTVEIATEAAIEQLCRQLGKERDECEWEIEIIDFPKKGFLGLKNTPAKVRVSVDIDIEKQAPLRAEVKAPENNRQSSNAAAQKTVSKQVVAATPKKERPVREEKNEASVTNDNKNNITDEKVLKKIKLAEEYVGGILKAMNLNAGLSFKEEDGGIQMDIEGKGLGAVIGRRGETLDALQYLTSLVANKGNGEYTRITVDCGDYRERRKETLEALAKKIAAQVLKTNISKTLEPMNPFERRIIHATVSEIEGVTSTSTGEEQHRRVVITTPTARPGRSGARPYRREGFYQREGDESRAGGVGGYSDRPYRNNNINKRNDSSDRDRRFSRDARSSRRTDQALPQDRPSSEQPKKTPEAAVANEKLYTKIDLD